MAKKTRFKTNYSVNNSRSLEPCTKGKSNVVQTYPSLGEILLRFQRGEDISVYVNSVSPRTDHHFTNRVGKVDITEIEDYVKKKVGDANNMLAQIQASKQPAPANVEPLAQVTPKNED